MKKVLLVLTSADEIGDGLDAGYELVEAAHPWKVFRDAGYAVDFASIEGGTPTPHDTETDDEVALDFMADDVVNAAIINTPRLEDVEADQYAAVYLVGGHGTMVDFPSSKALKELVKTVWNADGVVAAVCHGPAGLLDIELDNGLTLLDNKKVAGFSNAEEAADPEMLKAMPFSLEDKLDEQSGGGYTCAGPEAEHVVVDGNLVTGQNPASAAGVAKEAVKILTTQVREEKAADEAAAAELRAEKDAAKEADEEA